ncbi:MAG: hypothetical protein AAF447_01285, partial [Myxococcota bacterium]
MHEVRATAKRRRRLGGLIWGALLVACQGPAPGAESPLPREEPANAGATSASRAESPGPRVAPVAPPRAADASPFRCEVPALPVPRPRACGRGRPYPRCKWLMPPAPG